MQIKVDDNGYMEGYAEIGGIEGGIEYTGDIPDNFNAGTCKYFKLKNNKLTYDAKRELEEKTRQEETEELNEIMDWFSWYDNQVAQYQRCVRLGEEFDGDIEELDELARQKQQRIREIKENQGE